MLATVLADADSSTVAALTGHVTSIATRMRARPRLSRRRWRDLATAVHGALTATPPMSLHVHG